MKHHGIRSLSTVAAGALACAVLAPSAGAVVVAHWRFEPGAFTADSSPSGANPLFNGAGANAATSSTDVAGPEGGAGSALFDGNDFLQTVSSLDLTPYRYLRVSWLHRKQADSAIIVYEHTADYNANTGAFVTVVDGDISNRNDVGYLSLRTGGGYNLDQYPHAVGAVPGVWESFRAEINLDAAAPSGVVRIFDGSGAEIGSDTPVFQSAAPASFVNSLFAIGARTGGVAGFVGNIDELKIEDIPEPTSLTLLGLGALAIVSRRRR